ncbi:MAG TPA: MFS transporter [Candidatus Limnocylindrales bacterium]|nr:MFS transporter [Candidatus Limnocylindrales bacterium]
MSRSLVAVLIGTFTLRFSTGITGGLLVYYLANLPAHGGPSVDPLALGILAATFYAAELILATPFGLLSDRFGHHRLMQVGPIFGIVAVVVTWSTTNLVLLGGTRVLEGSSTAVSVPSILGFIALATAGDEQLRGRIAARFEAATIAGLGAGFVVAGPLWAVLGPVGFLLNAGIYAISFSIYRFGVEEPPHATAARASHPGISRYGAILRSSNIWLLAPTWIAVNATLSLYTSQTLFQLVKEPNPKFANQMLMGGFDPVEVSAGLLLGLAVFFGGLLFWGNRFRRFRRTTIILFGIVGGAVLVACAFLLNHSTGLPLAVQGAEVAGLGIGLFVLAGATPAALGLLADVTESFPNDRGAIMGLYSVFLGVGQIAGSLIGGGAAEVRGLDGVFVATVVFLVVALVPLLHLRSVEHLVGADPAAGAEDRSKMSAAGGSEGEAGP